MAGTPYPTIGSMGAQSFHQFGSNGPPPAYSPAPQNFNPTSKIELKISCRNLADMDFFSKSDPFVVFYMQPQNKQTWREIGRTETIDDNLNPDFVKSFIVDYFFEEQQMVKFEVYDSDSNSLNLADHDFIGGITTSLGTIVGEGATRFAQQLHHPNFSRKSAGSIIIQAEEVNPIRDVVRLRISGKGLDKKDFFGKSDPYLQFERCNEDNSYSAVHKTEVIKKTLNPTWKQFEVSAQALCNGDYDRAIRVVCNDWNRDGSADLIGMFSITLNDLIAISSGTRSNHFQLIHPDKKKKKSYKHSGTHRIPLKHVENGLKFVKETNVAWLELNFVVAVDFTASNGHPLSPQSLHYNTPNQPSQYVQVLQAVGGILEDYDTDKLFPAYGFGAKLPPSFNVHHQFALNFNPANPNCQGVDGIIAAYYNTLSNVQLYGPTNFAPVINGTVRMAQQVLHDTNQYFVLMIITDGVITDMEKTKEAIVHAATLPISIIIIGVGHAEFDAMEELDGDVVRLSYRGREAERDIVQFVPFRDYMSGNYYNPANGACLAKDVLHELPDQLLEYMEKRNIKPTQRPPSYLP